jgi:hypothetical protein
MSRKNLWQSVGDIGAHHRAGVDPSWTDVVPRGNGLHSAIAALEKCAFTPSQVGSALPGRVVRLRSRFDHRPDALITARAPTSSVVVRTRKGPSPDTLSTVVCKRAHPPASSAARHSSASRSNREILAPAGSTAVVMVCPSTNNRPSGIRMADLSKVPLRSPNCPPSSSSDSPETNSPQTFCRGSRPRSSSKTRAPVRAAVIAAAAPPGPPPTTMRS